MILVFESVRWADRAGEERPKKSLQPMEYIEQKYIKIPSEPGTTKGGGPSPGCQDRLRMHDEPRSISKLLTNIQDTILPSYIVECFITEYMSPVGCVRCLRHLHILGRPFRVPPLRSRHFATHAIMPPLSEESQVRIGIHFTSTRSANRTFRKHLIA